MPPTPEDPSGLALRTACKHSAGRLVGFLLTLSVVLGPLAVGAAPAAAQGVEVEPVVLEDWAKTRLGASLTAISADLTGTTRILPQHLVLALGIAEYATEIAPDSAAAWRRLLDLTTALQGDFPEAGDLADEAVRRLEQLEPDNSVMKVRRILDRIEEEPTADARVKLYETLLKPENLDRLGPVAAARIAFDLALLEQRIGELDAAAIRIVESVNLDPSFPQAAEMLAGLLRTAATSPVEEAELLAIAFTASPLDGVIARRLGQLVLGEGAYKTAADILDLAVLLTPPNATFLDDLIGDQALALWADGRADEARELLSRAHRVRQRRVRQQAVNAGSISPDEAPSMVVPPIPALALINAAIVGATGTEAERNPAVRSLFAAYAFDKTQIKKVIKQVEESDSLSEEERKDQVEALNQRLLDLNVDLVWARAWFGWTPPVVDGETSAPSLSDLLDLVTARGGLDETQRTIVEGWWAIHQDDHDRARVLLTAGSESSPYAAAGLALLDEVVGERQASAKLFLQTYREVPGRLVGLWCRSRLETLLGVAVPPPARAEEMRAMIAATLPEAVGRALRDPKHGVLAVQVEPASLRNAAFEPLLVDVTITNVSGLDLAIGPDGPITPTMVLVADAFDLPVAPEKLKLDVGRIRPKALVIPIDRRFRIDSQQSMRIRLDLSTTTMARQLYLQSYLSGTLRLRVVLNYEAASPSAFDTGLFGREGRSPVFRIDGLAPVGGGRVARFESMLDRIEDPRTVAAAKDAAALLGISMVGPVVLPSNDETASTTSKDAEAAVVESVMAMSPLARAWVMTVIPAVPEVPTRLIDALVSDGDVGLAVALAKFSPSPTSAAIVRGLESDNARIRGMAEAARDLAVTLEAAEQASFRLDGDDASDG